MSIQEFADLDQALNEVSQQKERLREVLQRLVDNVFDYEKVNNISPSPGRKYCWDTVEQAVSVLEQTK